MRQLFSIDALRTAIFGDSAAQIWQSFNQHVAVPKAAFEGFMGVFYTPMGLEEIVPKHTELNCPSSMPGHPGKNWSTVPWKFPWKCLHDRVFFS